MSKRDTAKSDQDNMQNINDAEKKTDADKNEDKKSSDIDNTVDENVINEDSFENLLKEKDEAVEEQKKKYDELNDKYLRLFSEFDNYRKRTIKEKIEYSKMASSDIITSLLPVFDDLARACELSDDNQEDESFAQGVFLIYSKFKSILSQKGVEEIPSVGEDFNTDFHEAVSNVKAESDEQKGKIIEEVEKGYSLHGKVLRYAKVVVAN